MAVVIAIIVNVNIKMLIRTSVCVVFGHHGNKFDCVLLNNIENLLLYLPRS